MQASFFFVPSEVIVKEEQRCKTLASFFISVARNGNPIDYPRNGIILSGKNIHLTLGNYDHWSYEQGIVHGRISAWGQSCPNLSEEALQKLKAELPELLKQLEGFFVEEPTVDLLTNQIAESKLTIGYRWKDAVWETKEVTDSIPAKIWFSCPAPQHAVRVGPLKWDPKQLQKPYYTTLDGQRVYVFSGMGWQSSFAGLGLAEPELEDAFRKLGEKLIEESNFEPKVWNIRKINKITLE